MFFPFFFFRFRFFFFSSCLCVFCYMYVDGLKKKKTENLSPEDLEEFIKIKIRPRSKRLSNAQIDTLEVFWYILHITVYTYYYFIYNVHWAMLQNWLYIIYIYIYRYTYRYMYVMWNCIYMYIIYIMIIIVSI